MAAVSLEGAVGATLSDIFTVPGSQSQQAGGLLAARFPSQGGITGRVVFHSHAARLDRLGPRSGPGTGVARPVGAGGEEPEPEAA
ncbi:MAG: hypothetical protein ACRDZQ_00985 [Acidimicrobiales bacterium]